MMSDPHPLHDLACSRRAFLAAAGCAVAVGCGGDVDGDGSRDSTTVTHDDLLSLPETAVTMRVRIGRVRGETMAAVVGGTGQPLRVAGSGERHFGGLQVLRRGGQWLAIDGRGERIHLDGERSVGVSTPRGDAVLVEIGDGAARRHHGSIVLHARDSLGEEAFDVVAHVPMEQYLPGVVAGELYAHWNPATFAAQAIAARSYAAAEHAQRRDSSHYDVTDGPDSQVYLGDVTLDVAHRAVAMTRGQVLAWQDHLVPAYYCACCGGLAANAQDAISDSPIHEMPPLAGHPGEDACTVLKVHQWVTSRPADALAGRMRAYAELYRVDALHEVGAARRIETASTNAHGRPVDLAIVGRTGTRVEASANAIMRAANHAAPGFPPPQPLWSSHLGGESRGETLVLLGYGMGHGAGLCQHGAEVLASRGLSHEAILEWYYPAATLRRMPT